MKATKYPHRHLKLIRLSEFIFSMIIGAMNVGIATNISGNQVQYLLRPIWRNNSYSSSDWFYTTKDLNFVFSWFTGMILSLGGMNFIIFISILLNGVGFYFLIKSSIRLVGYSGSPNYLIFLILVCGLLFSNFSLSIFWGIAGLSVFSPYLQPSSFGVLIFPSIYYLIEGFDYNLTKATRNKNLLKTTLLLLSVSLFHFSILFSIFIILIPALLLSLIQRGFREVRFFFLNIVFLLLILILVFQAFIREILLVHHSLFSQTQDFLALSRIPYHSFPRSFLDVPDLARIIIVIVSFFILCKRQKEFVSFVLLISAVFSIFTVFYQYFFFDSSIALTLPWRLLAILYPLATIVGILMIFNISTERRSIRNYLALFILDIFLLFLDQTKLSFAIGLFIFANIIHSRTFQFFLLKVLTIFLALYLGVSYSISSINAWRETSELLITQTDLTEISSWGVGVTNTEISNLRIDYGLSLFVDFKSVPFYPQDLIEWKKRIEIVDSFFSQSSNMCDMTRWKFDWILIKRDGVPSCLINSERIDVSEYVFVRKLDRG